jgi:hypothetical protein
LRAAEAAARPAGDGNEEPELPEFVVNDEEALAGDAEGLEFLRLDRHDEEEEESEREHEELTAEQNSE